MKKEILYYFSQSTVSAALISKLTKENETGMNLGFTFPAKSTHTCFRPEQESRLQTLLPPYLSGGLEYERIEYFRGNLAGEQFGIVTLKQPVVQWCPSPILSLRNRAVLDDHEPWGLTMDNLVALNANLRRTISHSVRGLEIAYFDATERFDLYAVTTENISGFGTMDYSQHPPRVVAKAVPGRVDIWRMDNGAIVCSNRFARLLHRQWQGLEDVKFQPIRCEGFCDEYVGNLQQSIRSDAQKGFEEEIQILETALDITLPPHYVKFLNSHAPTLPEGWLSVANGMHCELLRVMKQEREEAEPAMPLNLVPIFAFGNGDYLCYKQMEDARKLQLVTWFHENGATAILTEEEAFDVFRKEQPTTAPFNIGNKN